MSHLIQFDDSRNVIHQKQKIILVLCVYSNKCIHYCSKGSMALCLCFIFKYYEVIEICLQKCYLTLEELMLWDGVVLIEWYFGENLDSMPQRQEIIPFGYYTKLSKRPNEFQIHFRDKMSLNDNSLFALQSCTFI